jgi:hypothetical protein
LQDGLLWTTPGMGRERLALPEGTVRTQVLQQLHGTLLAHPGEDALLLTVNEHYFVPKLSEVIHLHIKSCNACNRAKPATHAVGFSGQHTQAASRWGTISMDFCTGLPREEGYDAVLVMKDELTGRTHFAPCSAALTAEDTIQLFQQNVVRLHGYPGTIAVDPQSVFTSDVFKRYAKTHGISIDMATTDHHVHSAERAVRQLVTGLRTVTKRGRGWLRALPTLEFSVNYVRSATTKVSAFEADLGFQPRLPLVGSDIRASISVEDALTVNKALLAKLQDAYMTKKEASTAQYEAGRHIARLQVGDFVMAPSTRTKVANSRYKDGVGAKIRQPWSGPFQLLQKMDNGNWLLDLPASSRANKVMHESILKAVIQDSSEMASEGEPLDETGLRRIREIVDHRLYMGRQVFLVYYQGLHDDQAEWVGEASSSPLDVKKFHQYKKKHDLLL